MRRVCVFTGTRAEYGLLAGLMKEIQEDARLELKLIVSGAHLSPEYGLTYRDIEKDGFRIDQRVAVLLSSDTHDGIAKSMGLGLAGYVDAIRNVAPDAVVILGDRYEALAFALCAALSRIPIFHIHGGEASFGSIDDSFRHCITKLSAVHLTCADEYRQRVIQMGEHPERVFNVGALGAENIRKLPLMDRMSLYREIGAKTGTPFLLITYHPDTIHLQETRDQFEALLNALSFPDFEGYHLVLTHANADAMGRMINREIESFAASHSERAVSFVSMGQIRYLSALKYARAVVGNSSSGILEAPGFKTPVVNIGDRQKGRLRSPNIIDCGMGAEEIAAAIRKAASDQFRESIRNMKNPFEKPDTANRIKELICQSDLAKIRHKEFYDLDQVLAEDGAR